MPTIAPTSVPTIEYFNVKRNAKGVTIDGVFLSYEEIDEVNYRLRADQSIPDEIAMYETAHADMNDYDEAIINALVALSEKNSREHRETDIKGFLDNYDKLIDQTRDTSGKLTTKMDLTYDLKIRFKDYFNKSVRKEIKPLRQMALKSRKFAMIETRGIGAWIFNHKAHKEEKMQNRLQKRNSAGVLGAPTIAPTSAPTIAPTSTPTSTPTISRTISFRESLKPEQYERHEQNIRNSAGTSSNENIKPSTIKPKSNQQMTTQEERGAEVLGSYNLSDEEIEAYLRDAEAMLNKHNNQGKGSKTSEDEQEL